MPQTFYIVTPCRNAIRWLNSAIASVVAQEGDFVIHYHIQDGGSEDGTQAQLARWEEILSVPTPLIRCLAVYFSWASGPDEGMYDAINKGFARLCVPNDGLMAWINADDTYIPGAFALASRAFADIPQLSWMGSALLVREEQSLTMPVEDIHPFPMELITAQCCDARCWGHLPQGGMFWKGRLWKMCGGLDARLHYAGDFELWPRFAKHATYVHLPIPLSIYTVRPDQLSQIGGSYEREKENIVPYSVRAARIRAFWRRRLLPPIAAVLHWDGGKFTIVHQRAWPRWGQGWAYFKHRLLYLYKRIYVHLFSIIRPIFLISHNQK